MAVFRFENKYTAPTKEQRERYMKGEREEHHFGMDGQIVLILWPEAAYLKDDIDNVRILFTGFKDKQKVQDEGGARVWWSATISRKRTARDHFLTETLGDTSLRSDVGLLVFTSALQP